MESPLSTLFCSSPAGDEVRTCTITTTTANELLRPIHDRMPVIIPKDKEDLWLDPSVEDREQLGSLLKRCDADEMEAWEASSKVNRPRYDSPENVKRT